MTRTTNSALLKSFETFELLRIAAQEREMPAQLIVTFLWVASHDGCKQEDLPEAVSMSPNCVSETSNGLAANTVWITDQFELDPQRARS